MRPFRREYASNPFLYLFLNAKLQNNNLKEISQKELYFNVEKPRLKEVQNKKVLNFV